MKNLLYLVAIVAIFSSCRTVKKVTDTKKETVEEITQTKEDSTGVKTSNSTNVTTIEQEDSSAFEIQFDTTGNGTLGKPEDYIYIDTAGNITVKGRIKTIKGKANSKTFIKDSTRTETKDTASKKIDNTVQKKKTTEVKHSETNRKGIFQIAFWPVFAAAIIFFIFLYLKRKKDKKVQSILKQ